MAGTALEMAADQVDSSKVVDLRILHRNIPDVALALAVDSTRRVEGRSQVAQAGDNAGRFAGHTEHRQVDQNSLAVAAETPGKAAGLVAPLLVVQRASEPRAASFRGEKCHPAVLPPCF